jgi:hypothetical protein
MSHFPEWAGGGFHRGCAQSGERLVQARSDCRARNKNAHNFVGVCCGR